MKVLTAAQMREVDRLTIERGIPSLILMENAGARVVDALEREFAPLARQRVVVVCGKGNNAGDGFVVARQLFTRRLCSALTVLECFAPETLSPDAKANRRMLVACGCPIVRELPAEAALATLTIDAVLGTGISGEASGLALEAIRLINTKFPLAKKVAVDIPSGLSSDSTEIPGEFVKADMTVTFTAAKAAQSLSPSYEWMGELFVVPIGSPDSLMESIALNQTTPEDLRHLFARRPRNSNKGLFGHVLVAGGSQGKSGAPVMSALAAYRSGAGLVTVCSPDAPVGQPVLMTEPLTDAAALLNLAKKVDILAIGPGLGTSPEAVSLARTTYQSADLPAVFDADALNALAQAIPKINGQLRVLTPHPGEMGRLIGKSTGEVQSDRLGVAQRLAAESGAAIVLKGDRTVLAFPDGDTWINPTGSPALAKGGTGDILTGVVAGMLAQHPKDWKRAVVAAVWLHGRAGELAGAHWGDESTLAPDLLNYLPAAMNELRPNAL